MPLKSIFLCMLSCLILSSDGIGQSVSKKEIKDLFLILEKQLNKKANNKRVDVPTELFFIILEIDSTCTVSNLHFFSDINSKDSSYSALKELSKEDFKNWRPAKAGNKNIVIPILSSAPGDGDYITQIFTDLMWPDLKKKNLVADKNKSVLLKAFVYSVPTTTN